MPRSARHAVGLPGHRSTRLADLHIVYWARAADPDMVAPADGLHAARQRDPHIKAGKIIPIA
jgi:hypothetical protein